MEVIALTLVVTGTVLGVWSTSCLARLHPLPTGSFLCAVSIIIVVGCFMLPVFVWLLVTSNFAVLGQLGMAALLVGWVYMFFMHVRIALVARREIVLGGVDCGNHNSDCDS